ncbi:MAG: hypothetical protein NZ561_09550 [Phycisphaerae bacterium]|nr:hypothetical protein [Phycisphaerae bacterium]MDW8262254.1 hypothetical protein [Phycisphaerales bacterium]
MVHCVTMAVLRRHAGVVAAFLVSIWLAPIAAGGDAASQDVVVVLRGSREEIRGSLAGFDDEHLTLRTRQGERKLRWLQLSPRSAVSLRKRVMRSDSAADWLSLARLCRELGLSREARDAVGRAVSIDPSLAEAGNQLLAARNPPSTSRGRNPSNPPYPLSTPELAAAAMERARVHAARAREELGLILHEFQTPHFIVFTDWHPGDHQFIRKNLEAAYSAVAAQFGLSPKDNIFVGKLAVFMFERNGDFARFARTIDEIESMESAFGYYCGHESGMGHLAMWKPDAAAEGGDLRAAQRKWARVLTHEFTHAFIHRYRSNQQVPRWLNEGTAEVVAHRLFPNPQHRGLAKDLAVRQDIDLESLFDDEFVPSGELYPVMETMVELLIATDRGRFVRLFDQIKQGVDPEAALQQLYGWDYPALVRAWRSWVVSQR